jgi:hypothetical protein
VAWAKIGVADALSSSPANLPTIKRLAIRHLGLLVGELSTRTWNAHYRDNVGKLAAGAVLYVWLAKLGVSLPLPNLLKPSDYNNLLRDVRSACSSVQARCKGDAALPFLEKALSQKWRTALTSPATMLHAATPPSSPPHSASAETTPDNNPSSKQPTTSTADTTGYKLSISLPYTSLVREMESLRERLLEVEANFRAECDRHDVTAGESDARQQQNTEFQTMIERLQRVCCCTCLPHCTCCTNSHAVPTRSCTTQRLSRSRPFGRKISC